MRIRLGVVALGMMSVIHVDAQHRKDSIDFSKTQHLNEVVVTASPVKRIGSSAFNAMAVDVRKLRNSTMNLSGVLNRMPGVKVREEGGVGSSFNVNLNGFTGKHVKLFIDGIPMEGSSSSFGLNNIPLGYANSIEVYKGVVPVDFGGDALGGAVNIVSNHSPHTYVDASYSYGSFNTHRSNLSLGWTGKNGFMLRLNAYQNYSDNDYKVKTQWTDLQTNAVSNEEAWFKRFHDRYHNEAVIAQAGWMDRAWADKLIFGLTYSREYAQIQNANLMKIVFGGKYRTAQGWTPSLLYEKRDLGLKGLNLRLSARYDLVTTQNVDTLSRTYSWIGAYKENNYQGEGVPTLAEYNGKTLSAVANLTYRLGYRHFFTLNNTYINYHRSATNSSANSVQSTAATFMRRVNNKNITGLSYKYVPSTLWNMVVFSKYYNAHVRGPVNIAESGRAEYQEQSRDVDALGWGAAATRFLLKGDLQFKLSYERTYRLPSDTELFGDGDYEEGEVTLRPEKSDNVNFNISYRHTFAEVHSLQLETGFNYRNIHDYIIRTIGQKGTAVSTNHGKVLGIGMDFAANYYYKDVFSLGGNFSLQNTRDKEKLNQIGAPSVTYDNRVPNLPYAFGGADASYTFKHLLQKQDRLTWTYHLQHVHRFFRSWAGDGAKLYVPDQLSHDAGLTYSLKSGKYNVSVEANNFTNALLYDNYSLQKPGRSFNVKFRYVFYKK